MDQPANGLTAHSTGGALRQKPEITAADGVSTSLVDFTPFFGTSAARGDAPFTGSWRPAEPLSSFLRENADGTWEFSGIDKAPADTGSIRSVSLHLSGFVSGT